MGQVPNTRAFTEGDGLNDYFNLDTVNGRIDLPNGTYISFYNDSYTTLTGQIVNGNPAPQVSSSAAAIATSGTITTGVGVARLNPGSAVTAVVMGTGVRNGQYCWVINEAAPSNSVQMASSGTSNVAAGVNDIIWGGEAKLYVWNNAKSLWYDSTTIGGTTKLTPSSAAAAIATSGTVTTANVGLARLNPGSAVTACVMGTGTLPGQLCLVVNEAAAGNSVQFAASGSSFVADGVNCIIPGNQAKLFAWDAAQSLWFEITNLVDGKLTPIASATAPALATSGTITTAGVGVSRVTPGSAVTSCVLAAGTVIGQKITVINASTTGANTIAFAASGTSNVADGNTTVISGLRCAEYTWDGILWYHS